MFYQVTYPTTNTNTPDPALGSLGEITGQATAGGSLLFVALYLLFGGTVLVGLIAAVAWMTARANEEQGARSRMIFLVALGCLLVEFAIWRAMTAVSDPNTNMPVIINDVPTVIPE